MDVGNIGNKVKVIKLIQRYSLRIVQVYAPTSAHSEDEVKTMYKDIAQAMSRTKHISAM